ncbi:MAG: hypothetical protein O3C40_36000 [Planctomycetota bacterium]|nr:hypothetical protein [Planctomycetota bacterium]
MATFQKDFQAYNDAVRDREEVERHNQELAQQEETRRLANIRLTYAGYVSVTNGMTFKEVVEVLGANYEELSRVDVPGAPTTVMFSWKQGGFSIGNCNVTFQGGKVVAKAQFGLK